MNVKNVKKKVRDAYYKGRDFMFNHPYICTFVILGAADFLVYETGKKAGYLKAIKGINDFTVDSLKDSVGTVYQVVDDNDGKEYVGLILSAVNKQNVRIGVGSIVTPDTAINNAKCLLQAAANTIGNDIHLDIKANPTV